MAVPSPVPLSAWDCIVNESMRRRVFWTTQLDACDRYSICGRECAMPGLVYVDTPTPAPLTGGGSG